MQLLIVEAYMKLLYLVPEFPSQTHAFFWREVLALRAQGVDVVLVSTRRPQADACRHEFAKQATRQTHYLFPPDWAADILTLLSRPVQMLSAFAYIAGLGESTWRQRIAAAPLVLSAARLSRLARDQKATHVHVHSFANAAHVAALAKILGGCSYSLTLHGDLEVYGRDHINKTRLAKFVTCVTAPLRQQVMDRLGLPATSVHLLSMGVDTQHFQPGKGAEPTSSTRLRLLTVARLNMTKGHRFALRALKLLRDQGLTAHYTIVGDGPERGEIEREVRSLGLEEVVTLTGTRSESEVLEYLKFSDALLLTSIGMGEAAPVAVMEAMACGLPVVCSIIGGTPDMIDDGKDGFLVEQQDIECIAERLRRLIKQPELSVQMGAAARARAVRDFDSHTLAGHFKRLIS